MPDCIRRDGSERMLRMFQKWLAPKANPIGVDFGTDTLRLAQVHQVNNEFRLLAAACAEVPSSLKNDLTGRLNFFVKTTRDLLAQGKFEGRDAVLALPAASMFIQHLRVNKMDEEQLKKALPFEAQGKLPIDPNSAILRHLIAGEVYQDQEPKNEVIVLAAVRNQIDAFLAAAAKAKLNVIGMNVEPVALIDCFSHVYRRKVDADATNFFVDIGATGTRAMISRGGHVLFARAISIGGDHFHRARAAALKITFDCARAIHIKLAHSQPPDEKSRAHTPAGENSTEIAWKQSHPHDARDGSDYRDAAEPHTDPAAENAVAAPTSAVTALLDAPAHPVKIEKDPSSGVADQACSRIVSKLVEELQLCRRYYEATFQNRPVDRLIFVGGESSNRALCQRVAQEMGLGAQVGDPLVRMGRISEIGMESGIDRRHPQPAWAVAIGLSMGPSES